VPYFLDANPNPDISDGEEIASAAALVGMTYGDLISRILSLGLRRDAISR
jgi:D-alanine-D-alanine ligase